MYAVRILERRREKSRNFDSSVTLQDMETGQKLRSTATRLALASVASACAAASAKAKKQLLI
jgi:hypothetical protein